MLVLSIPRLRRSQGPIAQKPRVQSWLLHQPQPSLGPPEKSSRRPRVATPCESSQKVAPVANEREARTGITEEGQAGANVHVTLRFRWVTCSRYGHNPRKTCRSYSWTPTAWSWRGQSACPHPVLLRLRLSPYFRPSAFDATLLQSLHSGLQPMLLNSSFRSKKGRFDGSKFERYM